MAICKSFLCEIWGVASFGTAKTSNPRKFSPRKLYFHQFAKVFSLKSFPLYGILLVTWVYLPSHKDAIRTLQFLIGKVIRIECLQELCKRRELPPVFLVHLLWCIPLPGQEGVPPANYLSLKKCGQSWVLLEEGGGGNRKRRESRKKWGKAENFS